MSRPAVARPSPRPARPGPWRRGSARGVLAVGLGVGLGVGLVAGCSDSDIATPDPSTGSSSSGAAPSGSAGSSAPADPSGSAGPSASGPSPSATPGPTGPRGSLRSALLPAGRLPGFNDTFRWRTVATRTREPAGGVGTCQRFSMTAIGAERVLVRSFRPTVSAPGDRAAQLVAGFPDALTARRAFSVLKAWHDRCDDRLRTFRDANVGPLVDVPLARPRAAGTWYLLRYLPARRAGQVPTFDSQGMAQAGSRITMLSMSLVGEDFNYPAGDEPMAHAVRRAGARL